MKKSILKTYAEVEDWFSETDSHIFAVDTELEDITQLNMRIAGISFCDGERACYIDLLDNVEQESILQFLRMWVQEFDGTLIMHNSPFDLRILTTYGIINE